MSEGRNTELVAELREESARLSGRSLDRGCVDSGIAANLADRAADALESTSRALSEKEGELAEVKAKAEAATEDAKMAVLSMLWMPGVRAALDNLPDDDPIEPYLEMARKGDEAIAALKASEERGAEAVEALEQCEEYFDNRADADCDQDGFIPNKEMRLLSVVRGALKALENGPAVLADAPKKDPGTEQREAGV